MRMCVACGCWLGNSSTDRIRQWSDDSNHCHSVSCYIAFEHNTCVIAQAFRVSCAWKCSHQVLVDSRSARLVVLVC
jgi:hypothetical protein